MSATFFQINTSPGKTPKQLFRKLETANSEQPKKDEAIQSKQKALNTLGAVAYIANETNLSPSVEPYIVATVPSVCSKAGSKDNDVQLAATKALKAIASAVNPVAVKALLPHLIHSLETSNKWKEKVAVLEVISVLVDAAKEQIALRMPELIQWRQVSSFGSQHAKLRKKLRRRQRQPSQRHVTWKLSRDNKHTERLIPKLIGAECMANPNEVPEHRSPSIGRHTSLMQPNHTPETLSIMVPLW
ncbi:AKR_collapsed_G0047200.mRNA.1.CDS.1 [Saccharomyces cerevisiae]|nr:AKR_collapsed_G0047200.mRNA.1.CDS.1 [Saccharomyces cerevisiae]